jgi:hypothetical protein
MKRALIAIASVGVKPTWTPLTGLKLMMPTRNARRRRWWSSRRAAGRIGRSGGDAGGGTPHQF